MKLVIAEKPSVAKSIAAVIGANEHKDGYEEGNGYIVSWCLGHLVGLADPSAYDEKYAKWNYDNLPIMPEKDGYQYTILPSSSAQYSILYKLMKRDDVESLIEATDAGREGELIFRNVYIQCGCTKPFERLWISSMEDSAIREGFENLKPGSDYDNLYHAASCREKADWLVGINFTRLFSVKYNAKLRVGRVQSPTLDMICKRESEITDFKKTKYYLVHLKHGKLDAVSARILDEEDAKKRTEDLTSGKGTVKIAEKQKKTTSPPKLYDLTTLQRDSNRLFGFTAQQTLDYTQSLYEKKLVTYPRTDSCYLTDDMADTVKDVINAIMSAMEVKKKKDTEPDIQRVLNSKKVSDHHAIIPTLQIEEKDKIDSLPEGEKKILFLDAYRVLCATGEKEKYTSSKLVIEANGQEYTANGKIIESDGWKGYLKELKGKFGVNEEKEEDKEGEERILPDLSVNQIIEPLTSDVSEHFTSPPKRYSEDTLLSAMERAGAKDMSEDVERSGIGTPATRAGIIEKLVKDGFIKREKKSMIPTEDGMKLIKVLPETVKSVQMTVDWENLLADLAKGKGDEDTFMSDIDTFVKEVVFANPPKDADRAIFAKKPLFKCPNCKEGNIHKGKYGLYCDKKCGMTFKAVFGKELTEKQWTELTEGKKVHVYGLYSKQKDKHFDAYLKTDGIEEYEYTSKKDGTKKKGKEYKFTMTFPEKNKKT